jgi:hypothetical protein
MPEPEPASPEPCLRGHDAVAADKPRHRGLWILGKCRSQPVLAEIRVAPVSLEPVPEVRVMVEAAKRFVSGEVHFSSLMEPTQVCLWWAKVHGAHPAIIALAAEWQLLVDRVWNEWGQHGPGVQLPVEEFRLRVAADLGLVQPVERAGAAGGEWRGAVPQAE